MPSADNKRIAKNAIFLYIRMIIVMFVRIFTARIILEVLGIENYGVYNLVGGVVVLFTFLSSTMSGATSRFLTYEIGRNNINRLKKTFSNALFLHLLIVFTIVILGETIGVWFINNKLVIPSEVLSSANWAYQFALLTISFQVIQVPFNACIISNEKMNIYAILEIINVFLILLGTYCIKFFKSDHLIIYSIMLSIIAFLMMLSYSLYCNKKFNECRWKINIDKDILKPMLAFSGFDLYGNLCVTGRTQGISIINNIFFGVIINAANGIATQVQNAVMSFGSNVITAFRPQIIKLYAIGDYNGMNKLINHSLLMSLYLFSLISVPIVIEMPFILNLWLKTVPEYTCTIAQLSIVASALQCVCMVLNIPIHATGKIKMISFVIGSTILMNLPIIFFVLKLVASPYIAYYILIFSNILQIILTCIIAKRLINEISISNIVFRILIPAFLTIIVCTGISVILTKNIESNLLKLLFTCISYWFIFTIAFYLFCLTESIKISIKEKIKKFIYD